VKRYSSGMYVRLAFAVAAHLEPEILIVDEVLAVGDVAFQRKCMGKLDEVAKHGRTVLLVSHNIQAIQSLCQHAVLLVKGQLANQGPTESVLSGYLSDASESATGCFDLTEHPARAPGVHPLLTRLVLSGGGPPTTKFNPEHPLEVEITIEPKGVIRSPRIAVAIEDSIGRRIMTFASYFGQENLPDILSPTRIRCSVPRLGLGTGRYLLSVSIGTRAGSLDDLHNAAWFEIGWNNNYGNGERYFPIYGPVLADSAWQRVDQATSDPRERRPVETSRQ
jgi:lipopolysaccharide transport system ATP-binding protein